MHSPATLPKGPVSAPASFLLSLLPGILPFLFPPSFLLPSLTAIFQLLILPQSSKSAPANLGKTVSSHSP